MYKETPSKTKVLPLSLKLYFKTLPFASNSLYRKIPHFTFRLDVSQNGITKKSIQLILALLHRHPPIQSLNLSHNKLGSSISSIADALSTNKTLLKLYLQNTELKTEGAVALFVSLRFNNKLVHLDVSMNKIGDKSGPAILDLIKDNMALQVLNMNFNQIRNGIEGIGVELANNNTLVELYLR